MGPACNADSSDVLYFAERQSKDGSPTFQFPLNLHDLLREGFIVPLMVPNTSHSTIACAWHGLAWLGYWFKDGSAKSKNNASRDTGTVRRTARNPYIPHVSISVTIQLRLGQCVFLAIYLSPNSKL